ncbi:hypothetical protein [Comamonas piscis]
MKNSLRKIQRTMSGWPASAVNWPSLHRIGIQCALFILANKALYTQYSFE